MQGWFTSLLLQSVCVHAQHKPEWGYRSVLAGWISLFSGGIWKRRGREGAGICTSFPHHLSLMSWLQNQGCNNKGWKPGWLKEEAATVFNFMSQILRAWQNRYAFLPPAKSGLTVNSALLPGCTCRPWLCGNESGLRGDGLAACYLDQPSGRPSWPFQRWKSLGLNGEKGNKCTVAEEKRMKTWFILCNEGNPILHQHLERGSEQKMVLSLSSVMPDARKGEASVANTTPAFGTWQGWSEPSHLGDIPYDMVMDDGIVWVAEWESGNVPAIFDFYGCLL